MKIFSCILHAAKKNNWKKVVKVKNFWLKWMLMKEIQVVVSEESN